ncbi:MULTISPECIES: sensor histidine kinase [Bacillota]|jgi:two-component system sensor histidine kinase AgrC|uniref:GHKL domain-containing protein n=2 Tax=Amedibacillus TaxID=2749846 RepID=A0A7G9GQW2_9FIRM|nr:MULTISPECIES: sensor histidine kinase [Bacillota]MCH4287164.1 GHKL domain-containing protein [Amedibacillus hominis]QNM13194.1 GHKL domain-containing protein [[Eubacterium] hominis]
MNIYVFTYLCSFCACCITSFVLLHHIEWKQSGWKFFIVLFINAAVLAISAMRYYPLSKSVMVLFDALLLYPFTNRKKPLRNIMGFVMLLGLYEYMSYPISIYISVFINHVVTLNKWSMAITIISPQLLILYAYWLYRRLSIKTNKKKSLSEALFQIVVIPLFTFVNYQVVLMMCAYYLQPVMICLVIMDMAFVVLLDIYLFYLFEKIKENVMLKEQAIRLEEMGKMQYTYYQKLEEKYDQSRGIIHDMKRHMQVLESKELPKENVEHYIGDMKELLNNYSHTVYSSHPIINVILHEKIDEARNDGIEVTCQIAPIDFSFMKEIDVTVIFANLLDNAIDACEETLGNKFIHICIDQIHEFIVIAISNSTKEFKDIEKSSKPGHAGLGLKNVAQTLDHYGGNMQVTSEEHEFTIHLYIPRT